MPPYQKQHEDFFFIESKKMLTENLHFFFCTMTILLHILLIYGKAKNNHTEYK